MAVALTGSTYTYEIPHVGGNPEFSISSITVPADADAAIVVKGSFTNFLDEINWDGDDGVIDFTEIAIANAGSKTEAYYMASDDANWPGSGSGKTLYLRTVATIVYRGHVVLFFVSGADTSDLIGGTDTSTSNENNWQSDDLSTGANDMAVIAVTNYSLIEADPAGEGQTIIDEHTPNNAYWGTAYEIGETQPEVACASASLHSGVAFSIKASAAGGGLSIPSPLGRPFTGPLGGPLT